MTIYTHGVGRIGKDAVVRKVGTDEVVGFSIAMDDGWGDKKTTHWFDCSGWGKRYVNAAQYLVKGAQVHVCGEQGEREHEGKTYKTLRLTGLDLIGGKQEPKAEPARGGGHGKPASQPESDFPDDDIPFATNRSAW